MNQVQRDIEKCLNEWDMTPKEIADFLGVGVPAVFRWTDGKQLPRRGSQVELQRLARLGPQEIQSRKATSAPVVPLVPRVEEPARSYSKVEEDAPHRRGIAQIEPQVSTIIEMAREMPLKDRVYVAQAVLADVRKFLGEII